MEKFQYLYLDLVIRNNVYERPLGQFDRLYLQANIHEYPFEIDMKF